MKPHKHAELIKAWADGVKIQLFTDTLGWRDVDNSKVTWTENCEYRIKPEQKPDVAVYYFFNGSSKLIGCNNNRANLRLVVDGETGELKSAEVLK